MGQTGLPLTLLRLHQLLHQQRRQGQYAGTVSEGKTLAGAAKTLQGVKGFSLASAAGRDWQWRGEGLPRQKQERI
ncbi:hypothetical protein ADJ79_12475 [Ottowia sp. oral taxon 894]|nr:hypothetical protein ADJ79_12475 [Ottowia sp. oral taxon 894]